MPKVTAASIALTALVLLSLTGCAGTVEEAASETPTDVETVAPLVAETTEPDNLSAEESYLVNIRIALEANGGSSIPNATDAQLLAAGQDACEQMRAGTDAFDVRVIEGEQPGETGYVDSLRIAGGAAKYLCPDMDQS